MGRLTSVRLVHSVCQMATILQKSTTERYEARRREFLVRALAGGLLAAGVPGSAGAQVLGRVPKALPPGSIYDVSGAVSVNGKSLARDTLIGPNDTIETGKNARIVFVVGTDAFLLHGGGKLELKGSGTLAATMRLATGALLSVFGKGQRTVYGPTSTIGIRGTGLYLEAEADRTYVCTCYGDTEIAAIDDPKISERVVSMHHDAPRYVLAKPDKGRRIIPAGFKNHTDLELMLIESLVGRTPPFSLFDEGYAGPRRY